MRMGAYNKAAKCCSELGVAKKHHPAALQSLSRLLSGTPLPPAALMPFVWMDTSVLRAAVTKMVVSYKAALEGPSAAAKIANDVVQNRRKGKRNVKEEDAEGDAGDVLLSRLGWKSVEEIARMTTPEIVAMLIATTQPAR